MLSLPGGKPCRDCRDCAVSPNGSAKSDPKNDRRGKVVFLIFASCSTKLRLKSSCRQILPNRRQPFHKRGIEQWPRIPGANCPAGPQVVGNTLAVFRLEIDLIRRSVGMSCGRGNRYIKPLLGNIPWRLSSYRKCRGPIFRLLIGFRVRGTSERTLNDSSFLIRGSRAVGWSVRSSAVRLSIPS